MEICEKLVKIDYGKIGDDEISSVESYLIYDYDWFCEIYSKVCEYFKANNLTSSLNLSR
jgi:hypothetical protein